MQRPIWSTIRAALAAHRAARQQRQRRRRAGIAMPETLEPRIVLDSTVVFNEIMYHPDTDEDTREWIELHNQMGVDMDLSGWRLSGGVNFDFADGTVLGGGEYLVIAASPVDLIAETGLPQSAVLGPLSGRLNNNGETLRLRNNNDRVMDEIRYNDDDPWHPAADGGGVSLAKIRPDAGTEPIENWSISQQVGGTPGEVNFAELVIGGPVFETLLALGAIARTMVPTDDSLEATWNDPDLDDSGWSIGPTGVGFDDPAANVGSPVPIGYWDFNDTVNDGSGNGHDGARRGTSYSSDTPAVLGGGKSLRFDGINDYVSVEIDVSESAFTSSMWFKSETSSSGLLAVVSSDLGGSHDRHVYMSNGTVRTRVWNNETIVSSGTNYNDGQWHHVLHEFGGDVGGQRIYVDGVKVAQGSKAFSDFSGQRFINIGYSHDASSRFFKGRIDDVAIWNEALSESQIQALAQGASPLAISGLLPLIGSDVRDEMHGNHATAYVRIAFDVDIPTAFDQLKLRMKYDDGFVAYLNGAEVARSNAPEVARWNSSAPQPRTGNPAAFEEFDISEHVGLLREGRNVLAIQGLNASAGDVDFLVLPELSVHRAAELPEGASLAQVRQFSAGEPGFCEVRGLGSSLHFVSTAELPGKGQAESL